MQLSHEQSGRALVRPKDVMIASALAAGAIAIMLDAWIDIFRLGMMKEELGYVLLAPLMIVWIAYSNREKLAKCRLNHGWVGLGIIAFGWVVFWYGYLTDPVLWRAGAVVVAVGAFVSAVGLSTLLRFLPAFAGTIFLVPIRPDGRYQIALPLQTATAEATQAVCDVMGFYVDRAGNMLSINGVDVTVAEACNGMRMILTLLLVCYLVAFTVPMRWWMRALLLLCSPLVAIAANVIRLVPTVWLFGNASRETAEKFHDISGWVMTVAAFLLLMGMCRLLGWLIESSDEPSPVSASQPIGVVAAAGGVPIGSGQGGASR